VKLTQFSVSLLLLHVVDKCSPQHPFAGTPCSFSVTTKFRTRTKQQVGLSLLVLYILVFRIFISKTGVRK
jgi:hypothetical protein